MAARRGGQHGRDARYGRDGHGGYGRPGASGGAGGASGRSGSAGGAEATGIAGAAGRRGEPGDPLVRICDLAGRPRGAGFLADADGTLLTSHEAVDGLARVVLHAPGGQVCLAEAGAVTPLPELGLALVATEGLGLPPLPIAPHGPAHPEHRFRLRLPHRAEGTLLGAGPATYTATDRYHLLPEVYELALDGDDTARLAPQASGTPLTDAATGAVLAVLATALHCGHRAAGYAIPLRTDDAPAPLAELLARNAATVPAYGPHLNLAGALRLTGTTVGAATGPGAWREPVERPEHARALDEFAAAESGCPPLVLGLAGPPGTGRSTELAQLAARRARGPHPAPTLWLRGADLRPGDGGVKDAVERSLRCAARIVGAAAQPGPGRPGDPAATADLGDPARAVAELARAGGRPLLVLLDAPEEMPPVLAHALPDWTAGTARWLRATGTRLVIACRPEFWEQAGALLPRELLYPAAESGTAARSSVRGGRARTRVPYGARTSGVPHPDPDPDADAVRPVRHAPDLPPCLPLADLDPDQAERARARHGLRAADLDPADAAHPLTLRLLSEIRAALPEAADPGEDEDPERPPTRVEIFSAYLDLVCLRIAVRLAAVCDPPLRGTAVRRLATRVAGRVHEAARRSLGPGQGELDREAFEELFPWRTGWASAVLTEGLLVPAGAGYRFAHEEWADWLQCLHLDLPTALDALVHRWFACADGGSEAPVRLPSRPGACAAQAGQPPPVPPAPAVAAPALPRSLPVPRHRAGPVVQALLLTPPPALTPHLMRLVDALDRTSAHPTRCSPLHPSASEAPDARTGPADVPASHPGGRSAATAVPTPADGEGGPADSEADTVPNPRTGRAARPDRAPGDRVQDDRGSDRRASDDRVPAARVPLGRVPDGPAADGRADVRMDARQREAAWWAAHLLREVLLGVADATPHHVVLRALAGRIVVRSVESGGPDALAPGGLAAFPPRFWCALALPAAERLDLLGLLLPADPEPQLPHAEGAVDAPGGRERFLDAAADVVAQAPGEGLPAVCGWLDDDRPLQGPSRLTVASAAQALLYTHRRLAVDDLTEALVAAGHPGADEVLRALAEDEPSAVCRAVDRWAHDPRPDRHVAAAAYGARAAARVRSAADRELLRYAALAILARPGDGTLHGAALSVLVRDPATRARHLPAALRCFADGDPALPAAALAAALPTDPEPVLAAFQTRLRDRRADAREVLTELARAAPPALARRAAVLVADLLRHRPDQAGAVARYLDLRLEQGPGVRAVLLPLTDALLREQPAAVRATLVPVFAAPGSHLSRALRQELLDCVLDAERDPDVLDALLAAAAQGARQRHPLLTHAIVHRVGLLLGGTAQGAARFDRRMVQLADVVPDFADLVRDWLTDGEDWDAVIGPSARRRLEERGGVRPAAPRKPDVLRTRA